jgi:CDP-diacylglycerol--glycerol-3-phosphate 3-phosphatidyltransferase
MQDVEFARAVEAGAVPGSAFHHVDHLRLAWVYLAESPSVGTAIDRMAAALRRMSAAAGHPEKYSQPTTEFWMYQVAAVRALMPDADFDEALLAHPRLLRQQPLAG